VSVCGSLPTLALMLGGQLWFYERRGKAEVAAGEARNIAKLAVAGLGLAGLAGIVYALTAGSMLRTYVGPMALPYFLIAIIGLGIQVYAWVPGLKADRLSGKRLAIAAIGLSLTILGITVCRECARIQQLGLDRMTQLFPKHARSMEIRGFSLFVIFFIVNGGLMWFVYYLVRTQKKSLEEAPATK
jgi:hypothetical protein